MTKKHSLLKVVGGCICLMIVLRAWAPATADSVWYPRENSFFDEHWEECEYAGMRVYAANGEDGTITMWYRPNSIRKIAVYENGTEFDTVWMYTDENGVIWTPVEDYVEATVKGEIVREYFSGWVLLSELRLVYDHISFIEEHEKELKPYDGTIDLDYLDKYVYWQYPGSKKANETWIEFNMPYNAEDVNIKYEYVDENNNGWVYTEVYFGKAGKGWIFLNDPTNPNSAELK